MNFRRDSPAPISEAVIFRNMPSLNVAKEHLVAVCQFLKSPDGRRLHFADG